MIINKGDDLILTIKDSTAKQIKIFTNGIDTITKDISDTTVKIDSTELATLKSGVIAYYLIYYTDDSSFKDGKYNRSEIVFTDYYYRDTSETYTPIDDDATTGKDYSEQIAIIKKQIEELKKNIGDISQASLDTIKSLITEGESFETIDTSNWTEVASGDTKIKYKEFTLDKDCYILIATTSKLSVGILTEGTLDNTTNVILQVGEEVDCQVSPKLSAGKTYTLGYYVSSPKGALIEPLFAKMDVLGTSQAVFVLSTINNIVTSTIKEDTDWAKEQIQKYSPEYLYFNTSISELPIGSTNATSYAITTDTSSKYNWTEEEFDNRFKSGGIAIGFTEGLYKLIGKSSNGYYIFVDKISGTVGYAKLNSDGDSCSIFKDAANAVATVLDSQMVKPSSLNTNYYTPTTPKQGITVETINGNFPLFGTDNDKKYKGIINVRFQQGGKGQSEYWAGIPEIQLAAMNNQLYFRSANSATTWTDWELINKSAKKVKSVNNMNLVSVNANTYYLASTPVNVFAINGVFSSMEAYSYGFESDEFAGEYVFEFEANTDFEATGNMLNYVYWNKYPKFTAGNRYRITIINNLATIEEFKKKDSFSTQTDNNG